MKEQLVTSSQGALRPDEINCGIKVILKKKNSTYLVYCFFSREISLWARDGVYIETDSHSHSHTPMLPARNSGE